MGSRCCSFLGNETKLSKSLRDFGAYFASETVPEWNEKYVPFQDLAAQVVLLRRGSISDLKKGIASENKGVLPLVNEEVPLLINQRQAKTDKSEVGLREGDEIQTGFRHSILSSYVILNSFLSGQMSQFEKRWEEIEKEVNRYLFPMKRKITPLQENVGSDFGGVNSVYEYEDYDEIESNERLTNSSFHKAVRSNKSKALVKEALVEQYKFLNQLYNYITLNHSALCEIISHIPSQIPSEQEFLKRELESQPFWTSLKDVKACLKQVETLYSRGFDVSKPQGKLEMSREKKGLRLESVFWVGLWIGSNIPLVFVFFMLLSMIKYEPEFEPQLYHGTLPVFRALSMIIVMAWNWGAMVWIYQRWRINWVFIMHFDPRSSLGPYQIWKMAALLSFLWFGFFLLFLSHVNRGLVYFYLSPSFLPLILCGIFFLSVFWPFHHNHRRSRTWLVKTLLQIIVSPFSDVFFAHFFISDILTSMPKFLSDSIYSICYYCSGDFLTGEKATCHIWMTRFLPFTTAIPLWFRFWQCSRRFWYTSEGEHLANAGKYLSSLSSHVFGAVHPLFMAYSSQWTEARIVWFAMFALSTCYLYYWDICRDWGLGNWRAKHFFLRDRLAFPRWVYWGAIVLDGIARFCWTWSLTKYEIHGLGDEYHVWIFDLIEIFRRSVWGIFRMENEHFNNCGRFRSYVEIPLPSEIWLRGGKEKSPFIQKGKTIIQSIKGSPSWLSDSV